MGLLGNWQAESGPGLNPAAKNPNSPAIGIAQWNDRAPLLQAYAKASGRDPLNIDTQIDFALHELHGTEGASLAALNSATNVNDAVLAGAGYERPEGYTSKNPMGTLDIQRRLGYGNQVQGLLGSGNSGSSYAASSAAPTPPTIQTSSYPTGVVPNPQAASPDSQLLGLLSAGGAQPNAQQNQGDQGLSQIQAALKPTAAPDPVAPPVADMGAQRLMLQRQLAQQAASKYLPAPSGFTGLLG